MLRDAQKKGQAWFETNCCERSYGIIFSKDGIAERVNLITKVRRPMRDRFASAENVAPKNDPSSATAAPVRSNAGLHLRSKEPTTGFAGWTRGLDGLRRSRIAGESGGVNARFAMRMSPC
ncbi:unnamed protein product [Polarella glacialis]|uniref:Uncharacterized protein n=1 Tax=Polarella glacialis TaxID=89957 RepID=A0A813L9C9_POLGL|nr:unnamed protein product [Polarella glacialis]CAE8694960.1 unnamed protein product [Polarella glacialis]CAE8724017.1 unnamed protein product [Polarella glacialis]